MMQFRNILEWLESHNVDFIIIGGVAASLLGSAHVTFDLDICYSRTKENLERLATALLTINAKLRNAPPDLPFKPDAETLRRGMNFTFTSDLGSVDLLGDVTGIGNYDQIISACEQAEWFGKSYHMLSLTQLLAAKRAAGRTKDLLMIPELEALLEVQQGQQNSLDD